MSSDFGTLSSKGTFKSGLHYNKLCHRLDFSLITKAYLKELLVRLSGGLLGADKLIGQVQFFQVLQLSLDLLEFWKDTQKFLTGKSMYYSPWKNFALYRKLGKFEK